MSDDTRTGAATAAGSTDAKLDQETASKISKLFDIRLIVGGLLSVYGVILLVKGLFDSSAAIRKGAGIHLNLWTGAGMLVVGLLMLLWMRLRPLEPPAPDDLLEEHGPRESTATTNES